MTQQQFEELKALLQANAKALSRNYEMLGWILEGSLDRFEAQLEHLSAKPTTSSTDHQNRLRALED